MNEHNKQLIEDFLRDCLIRGMTESTVGVYRIEMRVFSEYVGDTDLSEVDIRELRDFLCYLRTDRKIGDVTIKHYFVVISNFYEYLEFERIISTNKVRRFKRRYLGNITKNQDNNGSRRQLISVSKMRELVSVVLNPRDRAIIVLLAKTGVRISELISIDVSDINWVGDSLQVKKNGKRSNCTVFFDMEGERVLRRWLKVRETYNPDDDALFVSHTVDHHTRLSRPQAARVVKKYARRIGIHKDKGKGGSLEERFTPHCCRHWFTTHLRRSGMPRDYIKWLRGDSMNETMDIYNHIDVEDVRQSYLQHIPKLLF